jgi:hypothetical protein
MIDFETRGFKYPDNGVPIRIMYNQDLQILSFETEFSQKDIIDAKKWCHKNQERQIKDIAQANIKLKEKGINFTIGFPQNYLDSKKSKEIVIDERQNQIIKLKQEIKLLERRCLKEMIKELEYQSRLTDNVLKKKV